MKSIAHAHPIIMAILCLFVAASCGGGGDGDSGECGGRDEACCKQAPQCDLGLACDPTDTCVCGGEGEPCCPMAPQCEGELVCGDNALCTAMNECEQAVAIMVSALDSACAGRSGCCFCDCWNSGHQAVDDPAPCTCESQDLSMPTCAGDDLAQAQSCLADTATCHQDMVDLVDVVCQ